MTSATLYREGPDLDALLADLDAEHPGAVRVVDIVHARDGGVLGFFARPVVGVHYQLDEHASRLDAPTPDSTAVPTPDPTPVIKRTQRSPRQPQRPLDQLEVGGMDPLAALIEAAESADCGEPHGADGLGSDGFERADGFATDGFDGADGFERADGFDTDGLDTDGFDGPNAEFARLLLEMAAQKAAERTEEQSTAVRREPERFEQVDLGVPAAPAPQSVAPQVPAAPPAPVAPPVPVNPPAAAAPPAARPPAAAAPPAARPEVGAPAVSTTFELRRALTEIGVPVAWVPQHTPHKYAAVEDLVAQLPVAPALPAGPGQLIVVAGPSHVLVAAAEQVRAQLRLRPEDVWTSDVDDPNAIADPWAASIAAAAHRLTAQRPAVVAVATDVHGLDWAQDVVAALRPDAFWLHVEATCKPADTRALVAAFPRPDALVVDGADRTLSPASLWELQIPVALVDGAVPTRSSWAVLLLDRLAGLGV